VQELGHEIAALSARRFNRGMSAERSAERTLRLALPG
jgi:hypothetical protein